MHYRLYHKFSLLFLINYINGLIRDPDRMVQLGKICDAYNIIFIYLKLLIFLNGWPVEFLDTNGFITRNWSNDRFSISIRQKIPYLLEPLINLYRGQIYTNRSNHQSFKWYVIDKDSILKIIDYFKEYSFRSAKKSHLHLILWFLICTIVLIITLVLFPLQV